MSKIPMWRRYLRFWGPDLRADIDDELRFHLEMRASELMAEGHSPAEARREAMRYFGDLRAVRGQCYRIDRRLDRTRRRTAFVDELRQDGRFAVRQLIRSPGFTLVASVTLALGFGANVAVFSLVNALLLRPYPYQDADRIVRVFGVDQRTGQRGFLSYPDLVDFRDQSDLFEGVAGSDREPFNVRTRDATVYVQGARASASLFDVLGVTPTLGRTFRSDEDAPGATPVVVLSERFWTTAFDRDPEVIGTSVTVDAEPHVVVGVVPRGAAYPDEAELWVTLRRNPEQEARGNHWVNSLARLRPGVSVEEARAGLAVIGGRLAQRYPDTNRSGGVAVDRLRDVRSGDDRAFLAVLLGAVGFVLLIACANVSALLLARATGRAKEMALRGALGAGRGRLLRQLLTETALLVGPGALVGLALSRWAVDRVTVWAPGDLPDWIVFELDLRMTAFVLGASIVTALLCGLAPAVHATRNDLERSGGAVAGGSTTRRLRSALVVSEVALSVVLLVGAGLMVKSFVELTRVSPGFDVDHSFMMTTAFARASYQEPEQRLGFYNRVRDRLLDLPGVEAVGGVARPPLRGGWTTAAFTVEGQTVEAQRDNPSVLWHAVTAGYLEAAGVPILRGREFARADLDAPREVVLVSSQMADRYWPGEEPIGKRVKFGSPDGTSAWLEVIGVVGSVKQVDLLADNGLQWYYPYERWESGLSRVTWVVRSSTDPRSHIQDALATIDTLDPDQAVYDVMTLGDAVGESLWSQRLATTVFWVFGGIALLLASIGVYGLMSYAVAQRTQEIGIRVALGASAGDVSRVILRDGFLLAAGGALLGLALALVLGQVMAALLFEVAPTDPGVLLGVALLQVVVVLLASGIPARRASRVNPASALRGG